VATGSADSSAYLFDIGGSKGPLIQKLEGHKDRVYAVHFHPMDPILSTCSADSTIKIWTVDSSGKV
jgi:COMPASS component SWD3